MRHFLTALAGCSFNSHPATPTKFTKTAAKGRRGLRADRLEADVTRSMVRQFSQLTKSQRKSVGARSSFAAMLDTGLEALFDRIPAFYLKDLTWRDFEDKPTTIKAEVSLFPDCCEYFLTDSCRFVR